MTRDIAVVAASSGVRIQRSRLIPASNGKLHTSRRTQIGMATPAPRTVQNPSNQDDLSRDQIDSLTARPNSQPLRVGSDPSKYDEKSRTALHNPQRREGQSLFGDLSFLDLATTAIGLLGLIGTFIFGAWAIKSYNVSSQALAAQQDPSMVQELSTNSELLRLNNRITLTLLCQTLGPVRSWAARSRGMKC